MLQKRRKGLPPTKRALMSKIALVVAILVVVIGGTSGVVAQQQSAPVPWSGCCGMGQWPMMGPGMMGHGMMGWGMMRQQDGRPMMAQIPAPYDSMTNPLPKTHETVERGAMVYQQNCAACHGATGAGDGPAGQRLSPRPANLQWLSQMPMVQWDPFMYWTVAEGGAQYGNAMPAFKNTLPKDDIWAVIAYIQARLPQTTAKQEQK
jgi:mono/diheme cytochrome c family protein